MKNSKKLLGLFLAVIMILPVLTFGINAKAANAVKPGDILFAENFEGAMSEVFASKTTTAYLGKANMSIKDGKLYVEKGQGGAALYDVVPADVMKNLKQYTLSYDLQYIAGTGNLGDIGFIFGDTDKNPGDGNWVAHNWRNLNTDLRYYENGEKVWYPRVSNPGIKEAMPTHTDIVVDMVAGTAKVSFTHTLTDGTVKTTTTAIHPNRVPKVAGTIRFMTTNDGSAMLDNVKVVNNADNSVVYNNDFGAFTNTSTKYKGQFEQSYVDFNGGTGIKLKTDAWSYHKLVDESALKGQTHYTISYTVKLNAASQFGVAFGGYSDNAYCGHKLWIKGGADGWVGDEVHDANGNAIRAAKNANFGAPLVNEEYIKVTIDVNAAAKQMRYYFDGSSKSVNMGGRDTLDTVSSIYLFTRGAADVILDDVIVTAGGYADITAVAAKGVQSTKAVDGKYDVRFVGGFNGSLDTVKEVGFKVEAKFKDGAKTFDYKTTGVLNSVLADGQKVTAQSLKSDYIYALTIKNVPVAVGDVTFKYTPYFVTLDSSVFYGAPVTQVVKAAA